MKKLNKGFTLVELVIVIAVIGILAGILVPTFSNVIEDANQKAALSEIRSEYSNYATTSGALSSGVAFGLNTDDEDGDEYVYVVDKGELVLLEDGNKVGDKTYTLTEDTNYDVLNEDVTLYKAA